MRKTGSLVEIPAIERLILFNNERRSTFIIDDRGRDALACRINKQALEVTAHCRDNGDSKVFVSFSDHVINRRDIEIDTAAAGRNRHSRDTVVIGTIDCSTAIAQRDDNICQLRITSQ